MSDQSHERNDKSRVSLSSDAADFVFRSPDAKTTKTETAKAAKLRQRLQREAGSHRERLSVDLDADVSRRLSIVCADLGCTKADFVRTVIVDALELFR